MAQHDYDIANQSFPAFRTDVNNVLSAINSSNSGSSRPSSAVAGTIWLDTSGAATAQLLKMYDGAADILLGTVNFTANTIDWSDSAITLGANSVDSDNYVDGSIDLAHLAADSVDATKIADNAISEEHLDVTSITGHTAETSIADGDTILIHDASASALRKMTKANFVSGIGGANTPAFSAQMSVAQTISHASVTKVSFNSEIFDTDGCYDNSTNYRFTPTTAGKYYVNLNLNGDGGGQGNLRIWSIEIYKNGSGFSNSGDDKATGYQNGGTESLSSVITMNGSTDYLEAYAYIFVQDSTTSNIGGSTTATALFSAYKIIE